MQIRLTGIEKFGLLAANLKGPAKATLRRELNKELRNIVKPIVLEVRTVVLSLPVTTSSAGTHAAHSRGTARRRERGLRAATAAGVTSVVDYSRPDIKIVVRPSLPEDQKKLPRYLNDPEGWRHPVYGNRHVWVHQQGKPYFETTILRHRDAVRASLEQAIENAAARIASEVGGRG
jgi:hypothetical protein